MFLNSLSLKKIALLGDSREIVPLPETQTYENGLHLIDEGGFQGYRWNSNDKAVFNLEFILNDKELQQVVQVTVLEKIPRGALDFSCSVCSPQNSSVDCKHQWASFVLLWQALGSEPLAHSELVRLSTDLKATNYLARPETSVGSDSDYENTTLDSISLFFDEPALLKGDSLSSLLTADFSKYKVPENLKARELLSPRLWNLPEVFNRKLTAYSGHYLNEVNMQNRMVGILRYNFSNGMQISAQDILRHPLQRKVLGVLLPQAKSPASIFAQWPLTQPSENIFISQTLKETEEVMQALLSQVTMQHKQGKIDIYLQSPHRLDRALKINDIEFDSTQELDWRVDFVEREDLETEFKLVSHRKRDLFFFESFAVEPVDGIIIVHPWYREINLLQSVLSKTSESLRLPDRKMPTINAIGEFETKTILKHLRTRTIPVKITGDSRTLSGQQSLTEIRLNESGAFYIQHEARVPGQKNIARKGWTTKATLYLQTLSQGLPFMLNMEPREIASRLRNKRDWDLKLLKHLGILQYVLLEILSFHFDKALIDGTEIKRENLFASLHEKIQSLLIAGSGSTFVREVELTELCSKSVLACFEDFVNITLNAMNASEAFYSEQGEVVMEGVVEREFRLIYELLKKMALTTGGEVFKRSRSVFLTKVSSADIENDILLSSALFHFPTGDSKTALNLQGSLESLQLLLPYGFKIFYKDQPLQELEDDEFHVDFILETNADQKMFNWFELNPKFFLRGLEVNPDQILNLGGGGVIEFDGKLFLVPQKQLPSLKRLEHFWQRLQKGKTESSRSKNGEKIYQLPKSQTLELLALRASGVGIRGDAEWKKLCDFYDNLGSKTRELKLPDSMTAVLKPYQALGVQWLQDLYQLRLGALLADDMGLGKTLQTLCFLDDLRSKDELGQALIVVPSSLIFNWQDEIKKFTPKLNMTVFSSKEADAIARRMAKHEQMVVITTYGLLMEHEAFLSQYKWKVLIFDEAQNLKNISTKRTSAARSLTAQFKICLTGTPMENHYGEFYSLVDTLVPGSLGPIADFRRQFVNSDMVTREEMADLKLKIKPLILRRTKKEILDQLPEKQETKVSIAFEDRQKEIYRDIALSYNQRVQETMAIQGEASVQLQMLTALLRLRQACSDPAALPNVKYDKVPPKLETLLDSVSEIVESGESALVFTQFIQTLEHTAKILKEANIPVYILHGAIPTKQRQKILSDFNANTGGAVLVMTLKTGGVGLNLTKASYVFHLEPWWNPSVENQATDRAHRIGQNKAVQVFRYIMHESLEEKIELLKDRKDKKFQSLFTTTEKEVEVGSGRAALSKEDFDILLGIK